MCTSVTLTSSISTCQQRKVLFTSDSVRMSTAASLQSDKIMWKNKRLIRINPNRQSERRSPSILASIKSPHRSCWPRLGTTFLMETRICKFWHPSSCRSKRVIFILMAARIASITTFSKMQEVWRVRWSSSRQTSITTCLITTTLTPKVRWFRSSIKHLASSCQQVFLLQKIWKQISMLTLSRTTPIFSSQELALVTLALYFRFEATYRRCILVSRRTWWRTMFFMADKLDSLKSVVLSWMSKKTFWSTTALLHLLAWLTALLS